MNSVMLKVWSGARTAERFAEGGVKKFLKSEDGGVNGIMKGIIITTAVVVLLALLMFIFKDRIVEWLNSLFRQEGCWDSKSFVLNQ